MYSFWLKHVSLLRDLPTRAAAKAAPPRTTKVLPECWPHKPEVFAPGRSQMTRPLQESSTGPSQLQSQVQRHPLSECRAAALEQEG